LPEGRQLQFSLAPQPLEVMVPLAMTVDIDSQGIPVDRVSVDFAGVDMNMGFNRPELVRVAAPVTNRERFIGPVTLPICVTGRMLWQATVLVESGRKRIAVPFRFATGH
jgi:hypothetical protein